MSSFIIIFSSILGISLWLKQKLMLLYRGPPLSYIFKGKWEQELRNLYFLIVPHFVSLKIYIYTKILVAQLVKNSPAMQETWVPSLGWEDPLEEGMAARSSVPAWGISWKRSMVGYCPWSRKECHMTE